jgi:hypothetical protein
MRISVAFAKAQLGAGIRLPRGTLFVSVKDSDKAIVLPAVKKLSGLGFHIVATGGTARYLADAGVSVERINKVAEGRPHIVDRIIDGDIALIFNDRGLAEPQGFAIDPWLGAVGQGALFHHGRRIGRRRRGNRGAAKRRPCGSSVAGLL